MHDWHAVASAAEVTPQAPVSVRLLDHELVLWRSADGLQAWHDLCVHRGAKLSGGRIANNCLACPYHGWEYDSSGRCARIPAHPDRPPPLQAHATTYAVQEKYGLVWVSLGKPRAMCRLFPNGTTPRSEKFPPGLTFTVPTARA